MLGDKIFTRKGFSEKTRVGDSPRSRGKGAEKDNEAIGMAMDCKGKEDITWTDGSRIQINEVGGAVTALKKVTTAMWGHLSEKGHSREQGEKYRENVRGQNAVSKGEPSGPRWNSQGSYNGNRQDIFDAEAYAILRDPLVTRYFLIPGCYAKTTIE